MMKNALISVSDKTNLLEFAAKLTAMGIKIISTGGTHKALTDAGIPAVGVSDVTGFPECLDGRVKTLHPHIMGGLLAMRGSAAHMAQITELDIGPIDLLVCNLYPFKQTILNPETTFEDAIENIDIGGPSMLRAGAKNYQDVAVVTDPEDYGKVLAELGNGGITRETKFALAAKVFRHTAHYDALIADYLTKRESSETLPPVLTLTYEKLQDMRYGENPHQNAAYYREIAAPKGALVNAVQLHGKELSFNNVNDTQGALELLREFDAPAAVACKHATPCGVGVGTDLYEAYMKAYHADPVSIFGGIIVCNRKVDEKTAEEMNKIFVEIVLAPAFSESALAVLTKKKNIRLLTLENISAKQPDENIDIKKVSGGILVQNIDNLGIDPAALQVVTKRPPTEAEKQDLLFAWKIVKYAKSNGIALAKGGQSAGVGTGQTNRINACRQAIESGLTHLGQDFMQGAVLASDAFFPFPDCVEEAAKAGITAIIQPGGSMNDAAAVEACDEHGIAMVFTGIRHFRH